MYIRGVVYPKFTKVNRSYLIALLSGDPLPKLIRLKMKTAVLLCVSVAVLQLLTCAYGGSREHQSSHTNNWAVLVRVTIPLILATQYYCAYAGMCLKVLV